MGDSARLGRTAGAPRAGSENPGGGARDVGGTSRMQLSQTGFVEIRFPALLLAIFLRPWRSSKGWCRRCCGFQCARRLLGEGPSERPAVEVRYERADNKSHSDLNYGQPTGTLVTVALADLGLVPADALALTRTDLERLAAEHVLDRLDLDPRTDRTGVLESSAGERYEVASRLVGLLGRNPGGPPAVAERFADEDDPATLRELAARLLDTRRVGEALAAQLRGQVGQLDPDGGIGTADASVLRRLVTRCSAWGLAPDPPATVLVGAMSAFDARLRRIAAVAVRALPQLEKRLAAVPDTEGAVHALSRDDLLAAAVALLSPTGQLAVMGELRTTALPGLERTDVQDAEWLTVAAAVRPALARLELHQLAADAPLVAWTNRPADPWQKVSSDLRRLIVVYAPPDLDVGTLDGSASLAIASIDRFSEVIPGSTQFAGAAFGFDAPAARAQQAILLAVPPVTTHPLDAQTLIEILAETRELAHARMARPVDLDGEFWGIGPTALLPATGAAATPLEVAQ
jgi:hypothetical protein